MAEGVPIGFAPDGKRVYYREDRHLVTIAPTRSGKGTTAIIPALLTVDDRSVIVIDPKGQNAAVTGAWREANVGPVFYVNPYKLHGLPDHGFNPLARLDPASDYFTADARALASAVIISQSERDQHWDSSARQLIWGLILAAAEEAGEARSLAKVVHWLNLPGWALEAMMRDRLALSDNAAMRATGNRFTDIKDNREAHSVIATAKSQTEFLLDPMIAASLARDEFTFDDLRRRKTTVYIILPASQFEAQNRWIRLLLTSAFAELMGGTPPPDLVRTLFILDEFATLRRFPKVEEALGLAAGYGVQLWPILQDLPQLQDLYEKRWQSFLGNAGVIQLFAPNDLATASHFSERLGNETVKDVSHSVGRGEPSYNVREMAKRLYSPDELFLLDRDRATNYRDMYTHKQMLVLRSGEFPSRSDRLDYFSDPELAGRFAPDPFHARNAWQNRIKESESS